MESYQLVEKRRKVRGASSVASGRKGVAVSLGGRKSTEDKYAIRWQRRVFADVQKRSQRKVCFVESPEGLVMKRWRTLKGGFYCFAE